MAQAWRLLKTRFAADAFSGEGARQYPGRWNSRGTRVVYLSESISLAVLKILVHLKTTSVLSSYSLIGVSYREGQVSSLPWVQLPANWDSDPASDDTRRIGDDWIARETSLLLRVPSAIVPQEYNLLLNPLHSDFAGLAIGDPVPFRFDPRLLR